MTIFWKNKLDQRWQVPLSWTLLAPPLLVSYAQAVAVKRFQIYDMRKEG